MKKILIVIVLVSILTSCKQEGQGGENTIVAHPKHHEQPIKGATVYVRFGAKELPGTTPTDFDLTVVGEPGEEYVHIKDLRKGDYYLYSIGYDSTIAELVSGGVHIKLKSKSGETEVDVPVVE